MDDKWSSRATAITVVIKNSEGAVVKVFRLGTKVIRHRPISWHTVSWTPVAKGSYHFSVGARDLAGNRPVSTVGARIYVL
jgi:hypothetical protein